jgi:hypothetical protein
VQARPTGPRRSLTALAAVAPRDADLASRPAPAAASPARGRCSPRLPPLASLLRFLAQTGIHHVDQTGSRGACLIGREFGNLRLTVESGKNRSSSAARPSAPVTEVHLLRSAIAVTRSLGFDPAPPSSASPPLELLILTSPTMFSLYLNGSILVLGRSICSAPTLDVWWLLVRVLVMGIVSFQV